MKTYLEIRNRYDRIVEKYNSENTPLKYFVGDCDYLDIEIREQFKVYEPIHLWESYSIGDADEEKLLADTGYDDVEDLFDDMDREYLLRLDEAVSEYEEEMRITSLFFEETVSVSLNKHNDGTYQLCISDSFDTTGQKQHDFEYYVQLNSLDGLADELSKINVDEIVENEYSIRIDPAYNNDEELDEEEKEEVKEVCEMWGDSLNRVIEIVLNN